MCLRFLHLQRMLRLNTFRNDIPCLFLVIVSGECTDSRRVMLRINIYTCQWQYVRSHFPFLIGRFNRKKKKKGFCDSKHEGWLGLCLAPSLGLRTRARVVARIPVYVSMWQRTLGMIYKNHTWRALLPAANNTQEVLIPVRAKCRAFGNTSEE